MDFFIFNLPIDIASALTGGFFGLLLVIFFEFITKPRIFPFSSTFVKNPFNLSYSSVKPSTLYKIEFTVKGWRSPGFCELYIFWCGNHVKAKWDDAPNPLEYDDSTAFNPTLVPQTTLNTLMLNQVYSVPLFSVDSDRNITIFDGWWFGKRLKEINKGVGNEYGPNPKVNENTEIKIVLKGNDLSWSKKLKIKKIIKTTK